MPYPKYIYLLLILCASAGCSRSALHDAQVVVTQADSLWHAGKMYGIDEGDSATLAQTYETLGKYAKFSIVNSQLSIAYSHACYHYGRLLRKSNDPVSAMQVFIHATHSRTRDYHILGRIYSNMGSMCHLAGDFPLSYDMYERSANTFLKEGDSLSYYYLLNDMALELAEQGKKDSTLRLIHEIEKQCTDRNVLNKTIETKAILYRNIGEYDAAIHTINILQKSFPLNPTLLTVKAQVFDNLGLKDSALIYANLVIKDPNSLYQNKFNALYIIQHLDSTLSAAMISELASQREDIRYYEYEPLKEKLSCAVNLLKDEINWTPNIQWLYAVCITILVISTTFILTYQRKRRQRTLLTQQMEELAKATSIAKEKHEELTNRYHVHREHVFDAITHTCSLLLNDNNIKETLCWTDYNKMCSFVDQQFYMLASKLRQKYILNETEVRLCVLVLIGYSRAQIAQILPYALNSVGKLKDQTAKKLGSTGKNLHDFLVQTAVEK